MKVCVIGGGASGMMCATKIAENGHEVELFEKTHAPKTNNLMKKLSNKKNDN